jgi:AhpD family alkylhydroperoxidase
MNRAQVHQDIQETFGFVPTMFKSVPDAEIDAEWQLFKHLGVEDHVIPGKYKELIGLGISAVTKCRYCLFYHTEMAKLKGATDAEIEEALHFAKFSVGWSAYVTGLQTDVEQFKQEVVQACDHVRSQKKAQPVGAR